MEDDRCNPPEIEGWERFGVATKAMRTTCLGTPAFFDALETGKITARADKKPVATIIKVLEAASSPSPAWWVDYRNACADAICVPDEWSTWLSDCMSVATAPTLQIFTDDIEKERKDFRSHGHVGRSDSVWSDLEVLARFALADNYLVTKVRDFGHQNDNLSQRARTRALRYLTFYLALENCRCGEKQRPLQIAALPTCRCVKSGWDKMLSALQRGDLAAKLFNKGKIPRPVLPQEFMKAEWDTHSGTFKLLEEPGELLFVQRDVLEAINRPGSKTPGSASRAPAVKSGRRFNDEEIRAKVAEMRVGDLRDGRVIEKLIRHEPGFEDVAITQVRAAIKGMYPKGRPPNKDAD